MKDIFFVSSALGVEYGLFDIDQRCNQLSNTISSIKRVLPESQIHLVDSGDTLPPDEYISKFIPEVSLVRVIGNHPFIQGSSSLKRDNNLTIHKSFGEVAGMMDFLHVLKNNPGNYNRVFKLSGRYQLSDKFDYSAHNNSKDSVVILRHKEWGTDSVFLTRLWSFDYSMLDKMIEVYQHIIDYMVDITNKYNLVPIIEVTLFKFLKELNVPVVEVDTMGVIGLYGQDGATVDE